MPYVFVGKSQTVGGGTGDGGGNAIQFRHGPTTTTGSNHFTYLTASGAPHTLFITGNVVVSGTLEANTYRVNTVDTSEGSTIFGNSSGDTHQFTGSIFGSTKIQATQNVIASGGSGQNGSIELKFHNATAGNLTSAKYGQVIFNTGNVEATTPEWKILNTPGNYSLFLYNTYGGSIPRATWYRFDNGLVFQQYRNRAGDKINTTSGYGWLAITNSGNVGIGRDTYPLENDEKFKVDASYTNLHKAAVAIQGPEAGSQGSDLNALFVSGTANTTGGNNSFLINATCNSTNASGPVFFVSSSGQTNVQADMASDYPFQVINDGNNANRHGIQIQAGADDASGQTFYINCNDGDGGNVGYIENNGGTFRLVDPSDKRLKKNIKNTKLKGLVTLGKIKVRDFELKKNNLPKTGFIAQELEKVYPPSVSKPAEGELDSSGNPRMMGVSYEALVPLLVKAVQELSTEVTELKKKLADS